MRGVRLLLMVMGILALVGCGVVSDSPGSDRAPAGSTSTAYSPPLPTSRSSPGTTPSPSPTPSSSSCYPVWAQHDIAAAASVTAAPSTVIEANANGPRLTPASLAMWFGAPAGTPAVASRLLQGWTVSGNTARRAGGMLTAMEVANGPVEFGVVRTILVGAFREPTPVQAAFLQQSGPPLSGPITWIADVWRAGPHASLSTVVADLIAAVNSQGVAGYAFALAWEAPPPHPVGYQTYAGPVDPAVLLGSGAQCPTTTGVVLGLVHGLIEPEVAVWVMDANGIRFGFEPGYVVLDSNHAGDVVSWFPNAMVQTP
jgi:hypothetical protein